MRTVLLSILLISATAVSAQQTVNIPVSVALHGLPFGCTVAWTVSSGGIVGNITCPVIGSLLTLTSPVTLPPATVGKPYTADLGALAKVSGGVAPYRFSAQSGLPAGLTLSTAGIISGTPTTNGSFSISYSVTDSSTSLVTKSSGVILDVQQDIGPIIIAPSTAPRVVPLR